MSDPDAHPRTPHPRAARRVGAAEKGLRTGDAVRHLISFNMKGSSGLVYKSRVQAKVSRYPSSAVLHPRLFRMVTIPGICVAQSYLHPARGALDTAGDFAELVLAILVVSKLERRRTLERSPQDRADAKAKGKVRTQAQARLSSVRPTDGAGRRVARLAMTDGEPAAAPSPARSSARARTAFACGGSGNRRAGRPLCRSA